MIGKLVNPFTIVGVSGVMLCVLAFAGVGSGEAEAVSQPESSASEPQLVDVYVPERTAPLGDTPTTTQANVTTPGLVPSGILPTLPPEPVPAPADRSSGIVPAYAGNCPAASNLPESGMSTNGIAVMRCGRAMFPGVLDIGGNRESGCGGSDCDHETGLAVDLMVERIGNQTEGGKKVGDAVAAFFQKNAKKFGVRYIVWQNRIWNGEFETYSPVDPGTWRNNGGDHGNPTDNHMDHVHISVYGD